MMGVLIGAVTHEKEVRALYAEMPHTVLHILFAFFFGGSAFIYGAIILSVVKILAIPVIRGTLKKRKDWVLQCECSIDAARKYFINIDGDCTTNNVLWELAWKTGMRRILEESFDTEVRTTPPLTLSFKKFRAEDFKHIFDLLNHFHHIHSLVLEYQEPPKDVTHLAESIKRNRTVTNLCLVNCSNLLTPTNKSIFHWFRVDTYASEMSKKMLGSCLEADQKWKLTAAWLQSGRRKQNLEL